MSNERLRGFEVVKGYSPEDINLPIRMTEFSAGFDFEAAEDIEVPTIWKSAYILFSQLIKRRFRYFDTSKFVANSNLYIAPTRVPTGIKAYMQPNEVLKMYNRSSNPIKRFLLLANGVAVIDGDYYNNEDNDGHIYIPFINFGFTKVTIKKGERIAQGVFEQFLLPDNGACRKKDAVRTSGEGSTNR